jgi:GxxExxY protein
LFFDSIKLNFEIKMTENEISRIVLEESIAIHKKLGPGLLERVYQEALYHSLRKKGLLVLKEQSIPIVLEEIQIDCAYRIDILVENKVVIEIKSVENLHDLHMAQTLTYLKLGGYKLGLLINFNSALLKSGIRRLVNNL